MQEFELIAKTFQGLEEVLAQELTELGANNVQIGRRMVSFTGNKEMMYRANFCLRTALRVLMPIKHFRATDADAVYEAVKAIDWSRYMDVSTTFSVDAVVFSTEFRHSKFVTYKVKDAIADHFREITGSRPNISLTNPDIRLNIHIAETECTLSLDSSGESLHLRGYRQNALEAPINEVLAAGLIKLTGWKCDTDFIDPFCGSGTFLIEAALMARGINPGIFRKEFGFERWKDFDPELLRTIYDDDSSECDFEHRIYGYDLNKRAVEIALDNARHAGVADIVEVQQRDIAEFVQPEAPAMMLTNPPYGERLTPPDILGLYRTLGERLKHAFAGGDAWVICSKEECFEAMGLKPSIKIPIFNGSLDCEFRKYQIFDGKMQTFRAEGGEVKTEEERRFMADSRRFKQHREFKERRREAASEDEIIIPDYMRRQHRDFEWLRQDLHRTPEEREQARQERAQRREERERLREEGGRSREPREGFRERREGFRDERPRFRNDRPRFRGEGEEGRDRERRPGGFKSGFKGGARRDGDFRQGRPTERGSRGPRRDGGYKPFKGKDKQ